MSERVKSFDQEKLSALFSNFDILQLVSFRFITEYLLSLIFYNAFIHVQCSILLCLEGM